MAVYKEDVDGLVEKMLWARLMIEGKDLTPEMVKETKRDAAELYSARMQALEFEEVEI